MMLKFALGIVCSIVIILAIPKQTFSQEACMVTFGTAFPIYTNPLISISFSEVQPGVAYEFVRTLDVPNQIWAHEIRLDENTTGWLHAYSMLDSTKSGNCESKFIHQPLEFREFPDLCQYRINEPTMIFTDSTLMEVESLEVFNPSTDDIYLTTFRNELAVEVYHSIEAPSQFPGVLPVHQVTFIECPPIVYEPSITATVTTDTHMWSIPATTQGTIKANVPAGSVLRVFAGPTQVRNEQWYLLSHEQYGKGWIPSVQLQLNGEFPPAPIGTQRVLPNTQLLNEPNGRPVRKLAGGVMVNLIQGPVNDFYYVKTRGGCCSGWLSGQSIAPADWQPTSTFTPLPTAIPTATPTATPLPDPIGRGRTLNFARLWSDPDARSGRHTGQLEGDTPVIVWEGPVEGFIKVRDDLRGDWYYVTANGQAGWVPLRNLEITLYLVTPTSAPLPTATPLIEVIGTGTALAGARLWSEPNAQSGQYTGDLAEGAPLNLLQGPVEGPIRADGSVMGEWYLVSSGDLVGWVWVGRIEIDR